VRPATPATARLEHSGCRDGRTAATHLLRDARELLGIQQRPRGLGGAVAGGDARAPGRQHEVGRGGDERGEGVADVSVGDDDRIDLAEAALSQPGRDDRARAVGVDARRSAGRGDEDGGGAAHSIDHSPLLPPDFASTFTSVMMARLSTALIMS
jgi:hypothetical protein